VNVAIADAGSFREPSGKVYEIDGEFRRLPKESYRNYNHAR